LACAYTLQTAGHSVQVVEQGNGKIQSDNGVRCLPNMARYLYEWGLGAALDEMAVKATAVTFRDGLGEDAEILSQWKFHGNLMKAIGADFLFIRHGDLHSLLYELARKAGVTFKFHSKVMRVDPHQATVLLNDGSKLSGDVVVGADGYRSVVRSCILSPNSEESVPQSTLDKWLSLSLTIPTSVMRQHKEFVSLTEEAHWTFWFGNNCGFSGFPIRAKQYYAVNVTVPATDDVVREHWNDEVHVDDLNADLNFHPRLRKLLKLAGSVTQTRIIERKPLESYVHALSKVVLVGEAAHASMPNGSQNASLAFEDAVTLGNLFSHLCHRDQIPPILSAYEEIRLPRANAAIFWERDKREFTCMPLGPRQIARDAALREDKRKAPVAWNSGDDQYLRSRWEEYINIYDYNANEAADDWWTKWGTLVERAASMTDSSNGKRLEVDVSEELESSSGF